MNSLKKRGIEDIKRKIKQGNAVILTAKEISEMVREGEKPSLE